MHNTAVLTTEINMCHYSNPMYRSWTYHSTRT